MRISDGALVLLAMLAACDERQADTSVLAKVEADQRDRAAEGGTIPCATGDERTLRPVCTVDREETPAGLVLIVRHPDGGFRRLLVAKDGRGVAAADGAQPAEVTIVDGAEIEVRLGGDVYRLPATVKR